MLLQKSQNRDENGMQQSVFVFGMSNTDHVACQDLQNILEHSVFSGHSMEIDCVVSSIRVPLRGYYLQPFHQNLAAYSYVQWIQASDFQLDSYVH